MLHMSTEKKLPSIQFGKMASVNTVRECISALMSNDVGEKCVNKRNEERLDRLVRAKRAGKCWTMQKTFLW